MADKKELADPLGDELVVNVSEPRNWKGIIISLLVISSICSLIFLAILILSPHFNEKIKNEKLKLEDVLGKIQYWTLPNETWISENEIFYLDIEGSLMVSNIETDWKTILASSASLSKIKFEKFSLSNDRKYILLSNKQRPRNTFSGIHRYTIYDTRSALYYPLKIKHPDQSKFVEEFDYAEFGPKGSQMIVAFGNNLYYLTTADRDTIPKQITSNGKENYFYNGVPDLLYEEFIFRSQKTFWWSEDGNRLCYASIDNSKVQRMSFVKYGTPVLTMPNVNTQPTKLNSDLQQRTSLNSSLTPKQAALFSNNTIKEKISSVAKNHNFNNDLNTNTKSNIHHHSIPTHNNMNNQNNHPSNNFLINNNYGSNSDLIYPKIISYPYPKPGGVNPSIHLHIVDLTSNARNYKQLITPRDLTKTDHYVTSVTWVDNSTISVIWMNRAQNMSIISRCTEEFDWMCEKLIDEQLNSGRGWLDTLDEPLFTKDKQYYFLRIPVQDGKFGSFSHLAIFTLKSSQRHFLTHGQYVVTKILAHRPDLNKVYFIATKTGQPDARHLFSVTDMESTTPREISCLSCNIRSCLHNDASFSPDNTYFILFCKGPGLPRTQLRDTKTNQVLEELNKFPKLAELFQNYSMPIVKFVNVPLSEHNIVKARVKLLLPPSIDENDLIKYPVVVYLNNEPGSQSVDQIKQLTWGDYLASRKNYIVMYIDIRGSGYQGMKYKHSIYRHLGEYEIEDITSVVNFMKQKLPYINEEKIAVWGKGFGGYLVTSLIKKDLLFNCGIAIAPITSWKNYLSTFIERFMGLNFSKDNYLNYDNIDLTQNILKMKNKDFLLVHGSADQKINIQHSMLLIKILTESNIPYKLQLYPDGDHFLKSEQYHLYKTMEKFLDKCFYNENNEDGDGDFPLTRIIKGKKRIVLEDDRTNELFYK